MAWSWVVTDLDGVQIGRAENAYERKWSYQLNGLDQASFRLRLDNALATEITDRDGDVLCKVYDGSTLRFIGELTTADEVGPNCHRVLSRERLMNRAYSLGTDVNGNQDVRSASNQASITDRGLYEEVVAFTNDSQSLRQAYINEAIRIRATPRLTVTYQPTQQGDPGLSCNFAGPLWRLQKRLLKSSSAIGPDPNADIASALITAANLEGATGIVEGTIGSTITTVQDFGPAYKPIAECLTDMSTSKAFPFETPGTWADEDLFSTGSGFLTGRVVAAGGTWQGAGDADDFVVTPPTVQRGASGDSGLNGGRYCVLSNSFTDDVVAQTACWYSGGRPTNAIAMGVECSYSSTSSNLLAKLLIGTSSGADTLIIFKGSTYVDSTAFPVNPDTPMWLQIGHDDQGNWACWCWPQSETDPPVAPVLYGYDADLATGGSLANGKCGIYGENQDAGAGRYVYFDHLRAGAITQPLDWQGLDFEFAPQEPSGGTIALFNASAQIGTIKPNVIFDLGGGNTRVPTFGTDYIVGDTVTARALYNNNARFNGLVRVFGIDITIDENGKQTISPNFSPD